MIKLTTKHCTRNLSLFNIIPAYLAKLGAIRGSSREKFYLELGLESLQC